MSKSLPLILFACVAVVLLADSAFAQRQPGTGGRPRGAQQPEASPLPSDRRLLQIHLDFVREAETLAKEYEEKEEWDKARDVYREILKLVPQYTGARSKLNEIFQREATAGAKSVDVDATGDWQSAGIKVIQGKPISITATGSWTFSLSSKLGPNGMSIPEELRDFPLGCLIGVIDTGDVKEFKPFVVGSEKSIIAEHTGWLYFRMYDIDPKDNDGTLKVEISGTFEEGKPKKN